MRTDNRETTQDGRTISLGQDNGRSSALTVSQVPVVVPLFIKLTRELMNLRSSQDPIGDSEANPLGVLNNYKMSIEMIVTSLGGAVESGEEDITNLLKSLGIFILFHLLDFHCCIWENCFRSRSYESFSLSSSSR